MSPFDAARPLVVWVVSDGKPGHLNQSLGLAEALARRVPARLHPVPALPRWRAAVAWLTRRLPGAPADAPHLIVGAGHATHLTLLAARRAHGGRTVVLMKPSLPRRCFDLCIVPRHDGLPADARTLVSEGALNRVHPASAADAQHGLLLIGGPSPHFDWNGDAIAVQVRSIVARAPAVRWTLATSRRTPPGFAAQLAASPNLEVVPHTATGPDWLPAQLARAATVWVTPDSASMVYEALTAGAAVGVFDLPARPASRVARAIAGLADDGQVTRFADWCAHGRLPRAAAPLAEAARCAHWILEWLKRNA